MKVALITTDWRWAKCREHGRIEAIKKCVYQLKILINQEEASVSDVFHLTQEFKADDIQQAFHLWIRDKPRNITIQLFYKNNANHKKWFHLADVAVPIPSPYVNYSINYFRQSDGLIFFFLIFDF